MERIGTARRHTIQWYPTKRLQQRTTATKSSTFDSAN